MKHYCKSCLNGMKKIRRKINMANIVIYGAEISGICAALKARANLLNDGNEHNIKIIVTNPSGKLGGLATIGGLNCWDVFNAPLMEYDRAAYETNNNITPKCCQKGSFGVFLKNYWQNYKIDLGSETYTIPNNTSVDHNDSMEVTLEKHLLRGADDKVKIECIRAMDIVDIDYITDDSGNKTINKLYIRSVYRSDDGYIRWGRKTRVVEGDYFIDASDDGKLTSALTEVTVGRYDWPASTLEECEKTNIPVARQQAATLYFQVNNMNESFLNENKMLFVPNGGNDAVNNDTKANTGVDNGVYTYNVQHRDDSTQFLIKKYNLAKNGHSTNDHVYCVNTFLIFNVDGRAHYRDLTTKFYPRYMLSDSMHRDEAWVAARNEIGTTNFQNKLRGFVGFEECNIVKVNGKPVVAEQLYIRESVHLPLVPGNIGNGTEESNYAVKRSNTLMKFTDGVDDLSNVDNYPDYNNKNYRIGLGSYNVDIHPYVKSDVLQWNADENKYEFLNMAPSAKEMRPDLSLLGNEKYMIRYAHANEINEKGEIVVSANTQLKSQDIPDSPLPPTYLPYTAMLPYDVTNLLVAGTASGICSFSWGELRVLPNLCVLGDAAGVTLAYLIRRNAQTNVEPITLHSIKNNQYRLNDIRTILNCVYTDAPISLNGFNENSCWGYNDAITEKADVVTRGVWHDNYCPDWNEFVYKNQI